MAPEGQNGEKENNAVRRCRKVTDREIHQIGLAAPTRTTTNDPMDNPLEIDALGLLCPLPVLRLRKRMQGAKPGTLIRLLADDPAAQIDVPHFCNESGHHFEGADAIRPPDGNKVPLAYTIRVAQLT